MPSVHRQQQKRGTEGTVKKATTSEIVAIVLAFISLFIVMIAGSIAVWLTSEVRVFGLVMLPTAIVAGLLVVYFDWLAKRHDRILADRDNRKKTA
jgi:hypothetical protein